MICETTIKEAFYRLAKRLSFAAAWLDRFVRPCFNYFLRMIIHNIEHLAH